MSLITTLITLALCGAVFLFCLYKVRQPHEPGEVRLVPYQGILFVALLGVILMMAHLVTLATGTPFKGRGGF